MLIAALCALVAHLARQATSAIKSRDYQLPHSAIEAALAYYQQHKEYIDARILLNSA